MIIKPVDRKNNYIGEYEFSSFNEVFDWCLYKLEKATSRCDDILFIFQIQDSGEVFYLHGTPNGEDSVLYGDINFK